MRGSHSFTLKFKRRILPLMSCLALMSSPPLHASSSAEETAFFDIPVGGRPAALGGAYSALAEDAYAVNLNPAGLGFLRNPQMFGQHLKHLGSGRHQYLTFAAPMRRSAACGPSGACPGSSLGSSVQHFSGGEYVGADEEGNSTENFSSGFTVYNIAVGHAFTKRLSLGLTGKMITARIADVSANAYAGDAGVMYQASDNLTLAAVLNDVGSKLTFLEEGDPLPTALHLGLAYGRKGLWSLSAEGVARRNRPTGGRLGFEFNPMPMASFRVSYRTDTTEDMGPLAGLAAGIGMRFGSTEVSYAWKPLADLGATHYLSFGFSFNERPKKRGGS